MGRVLHGSATTTEAVRRAIQHSEASLRALAKRYGINRKTVAKWKRRTSVADLPTGPKEARSTVLSLEQEAIVIARRRLERTRLLNPAPLRPSPLAVGPNRSVLDVAGTRRASYDRRDAPRRRDPSSKVPNLSPSTGLGFGIRLPGGLMQNLSCSICRRRSSGLPGSSSRDAMDHNRYSPAMALHCFRVSRPGSNDSLAQRSFSSASASAKRPFASATFSVSNVRWWTS